MLLYAHREHTYLDRVHHIEYRWAAGTVRDVSEETASVLLEGHPTKFCDVTGEDRPESHSCGRGLYKPEVIEAPPVDRMMVATATQQSKPIKRYRTRRG